MELKPNVQKEAIKPEVKPIEYDKDFNNLDSLLAEMATPKQDFTPKISVNNDSPEKGGHVDTTTNAAPGAFYDPSFSESKTINTPASPEAKARSGKASAEALDLGVSLLAMMVAGEKDRSQFSASYDQKNEIGKAIAEYTKDKPFDMPPWFTLALLIVVTYTPIVSSAFKMKKLQEHDSRIDDIEKKLNKQQNAKE